MPLNKDCAGREYPPITTEVTLEAMQNYARAYNDDNPAYFDASRAVGIVAPPMFGVVVTWNAVMGATMDPNVGADLLRSVHGEQDMEFLRPIRPGDVIIAAAKIASIETKVTGETMTVEVNARDRDGKPVQKTLFSIFVRGRRNRDVAAAEPRIVEPDRGAPLYTVAQTIDKDQTFRYAAASGDRNPIHVDETVAKMAGLPGIIVHGLCTMAFTSKVIIDNCCAGDPTRLKRLRVRFSRPVLPGQTITTKVWSDGERDGRLVFAYETFNAEGPAVIKSGLAEVTP
ncbi:MAG: MaoC/PaaZ C-terminal domain-containing protein [Candidatus Binatus sp.]|uniref:MaoC/PaaZ C-terminal domain-containing protein n=1 Tax=Candidatus Binatus sp. TaxID=2811406 RepID=UPI002717100D|nr:MaoC/PaaZ C-terminal domain-containing protein [Candidatus Binatus sp.]MDO8432669.1 MaoC/PaaZ C-terminal domain-containing protein [Candidatus Binatus sp.]